ncbi:MAG TPA: GlsB/YeaQ/YmgE family stress response membrane protein [Accumulibacter sp.]|uniref:GlsB/YeaQ/YmgE family stress response membrane protein n=1 Tax=Accumulibacter sp. TaxID=2053492 RepID=UPI002BE92A57|nr:GlsB/YeaQ/YmgE family stress response membrane protein [Accumulibacter sp.]HRD88569.1 GlsB/YeaQ/YmgE family stress response membrane protein [Accumulibacter sp.]
MNLIVTIVVGFIVGLIAKFLMPGPDGGGFILTTILGIAGAFVGSFVAGALGMTGAVGWIASILGAILILVVLRLIKKA